MHRAHPDDDWKKIDAATRFKKVDKIKKNRSQLLKNKRSIDNYTEFFTRDFSGTWHERGSNNLSGRIRTADIDWDNNIIYCASSGGNIWKGTIEGENWESLTDYMQILGITFIKIINTELGQRILIGSENNGFYFSDNDCFTLTQATGLSNNFIKRFIIEHNTNYIYALANDYPSSIYTSTNLGESFELLLSLDSNILDLGSTWSEINYFDIFTSRYFDMPIYLMHANNLYEINNNDLIMISNWNVPDGYGLGFDPKNIVLSGGVSNSGIFLYAYTDTYGGHIFRSINGGLSWSHQGESPSDWWWINGFNSSNLERDKIFIGGMELFKSTNIL